MLDPFHLQWVNKLYRKHKSVGVIFPYRKYIKIAKKSDFCEELLSENDFEVVLVNFCCYEYGANASKAVQISSVQLCQLTNTASFIATTPMKKHI